MICSEKPAQPDRMVASLAFADFFWGVALLSGYPARRLSSSISYLNAICYVRIIFNFSSGYGNVYNTLLCTLDRYIFISRPLRYQSIVTPGRASVAILTIWMLIALQIALMVGLGTSPDAENSCMFAQVINRWAQRESIAQYVLITFFVIVPIYAVIGHISWKASRNEPHITNFPREARERQREKLRQRRWAKVIGMVLGNYLMCYVPFLVGDAIITFSFDKPYSFEILLVRKILFSVYNMQSILNPFIYAWKNVQFRQAFNKLLCKKCQTTPIQ